MPSVSRRSWVAAFTVALALICSGGTPAAAVKGRVDRIGPPGNETTVLTVAGTPYEMGYAHGRLLGDRVRDFVAKVTTGMLQGMGVGEEKLDGAYAAMEPLIPPHYKEEMRGLADGSRLDLKAVQRAHAIPDLSEYHCTFFAAWGKATRNGHLYQIRALDYATDAHIQDNAAIIIHKPKGYHAFANIGWTGFIGVVSGINDRKVAMSEIGDNFGAQHETLQGEPMPFVMREVLERCANVGEATKVLQSARRTSSFLFLVGDAKAPDARAYVTASDFCRVYTDKTLPFEGRRLPQTLYMSMGVDSDWNGKVYQVLKARHGSIDESVAMADVMTGLGTGSLHAVAFDATALKLWVANAGPDRTPAYKREYVPFDLGAAFRRR